MTARVDVLLVHWPVRTRTGEVSSTAVTNLDIHDIARAARTYGVHTYHLVTPIAAQRRLVESVVAHWCEGTAGQRVPARAEALGLVRVASQVEDVLARLETETGRKPLAVATAAAHRGRPITPFADFRRRLETEDRPVALIFGTGWGLADELLDRVDVLLAPIAGPSDYNHLSVRVAVGVALDRLLGL